MRDNILGICSLMIALLFWAYIVVSLSKQPNFDGDTQGGLAFVILFLFVPSIIALANILDFLLKNITKVTKWNIK